MDRRFLLAVVLSALVLIVFQMWFGPKEKARREAMHAADSVAAAPATPATASGAGPAVRSPAGSTGAVASGAPAEASAESLLAAPGGLDLATAEQTTTVRSDLYQAEFTNRGGRILHWRLPRYDGPDGRPVDLVRTDAELDVKLATETGVSDLGQALYALQESDLPGGGKRLVFTAGRPGGLRITKTYTLPADRYLVDLDISIEGAGDAVSYRLAWDGGIPPAEKNEKQYRTGAGTIAFLGKDKETLRPGSFKKTEEKILDGNVKWAGVRNKYFMAVMIPPEGASSRVIATGDAVEHVTGAEVVMPVLNGAADHAFHVYLGPMEYKRLKADGHELEQAVDLGWKIFRPISKWLLVIMVWMYKYIPNYGIVIIIISTLTKFMFYPLTRTSIKSMKAMQRLQPEFAVIKEKYKDDSQRQQAAMMELYKKHKVNPMGGCLPIVVQMPVFYALYAVLANSIAMRGAPFALWINDLSSPDTIATVAGFGLHVLPFILFLTTVAQQKLTPTGADPRQKMLGYMMPLVMLFIFYSFPAGLNLYWTVNNILTVAQQWAIHREEPAGAPAPSAA